MASTVSSSSQGLSQPKLSATAMIEVNPRTMWNYVQDRNGRTMTEPVVGFYFKPPLDAKCRWSTDNGRQKAQHLQFGLQLPRRTLILWNDEKLETEAAFYREKYWEDMKTLTAPQQFEDLYEYFDSATMWMHGALNCWNLVNLLIDDARTNWHEHENRVAAECNAWVLDWLESFPAAYFNHDRLVSWNQKTDILTAVTTHYDWTNDLRDLNMVSQNILRECLLFHFERLTGKKPAVACFNHHAATDIATPPPVAAPGQNSEIGSTDIVPKILMDDQSMFEAGSSPPQGLATIPEHASPVKASAKATGLTIDTTASSNIPKHTVSAPATAVPQTTVMPYMSGEAEECLDQKDGNDLMHDELFSLQAMAEKIEVKARQLSAQSAPGEKSESGPSTRINSQPRTASSTPKPVVPAGPKRFTVVTSATNTHHEMNQPHSRGPRRSPPRGTAGRRQGATSVPTYYLAQRPMAQQGAPTGHLPPPQHMMPPFGPHNNMQQTHAGFVPPTPAHGLPPHPNAFTAQGPPPPPPPSLGAGMPPIGPPGVPFQNQFPMPPPRADMPPFNNPQGHSMNAPPQYMAQPNVGTPMYQPNGYIHQPPQQPGNSNGNKKIKQNGRRDSVNSSGSRKLRDDPLHGPVYAMNHRTSSSASSGVRKSSLAIPNKTPQGPFGRCIHDNLGDFRDAFTQLFDECTCARCVEASRSVFVKHGKPDVPFETVVATLKQYFSNWEPTDVKMKSQNRAALVVFNTDHNAVNAIQNYYSAGKRPSIPGLSGNTFVWYPLFSKHYTPKAENSTGAPRGLVEAQKASRRLSGPTAQRRGSNPYLGQRPNFNNPNFGKGIPGVQQLQYLREQRQGSGQPSVNNLPAGAMHTIPYHIQPPQKSQRTLWQPPPVDRRRKSTNTPSTKEETPCSPKTCPKEPVKERSKDEDWRSKPPSEEAIEKSEDEVAVTDTTSNVSSQGARSIKICLPNESGSARSRSASPGVEDTTVQEQAKEKASPKVEANPREEPEKVDDETHVEPNKTKETDNKSSSGPGKPPSEPAVTVEESQPTIAAELVQTDVKDDQRTEYSYSRVTSEITEPTEAIDISTVIRHRLHKSRSPLPTEWNNEPAGSSSDLGRRFGALQDEIQGEIQSEEHDSYLASALKNCMEASQIGEKEGASATTVPKEPTDSALPEKPQAKQSKKKGAKGRKKKAQAIADAHASGPSSNTPSESQSRGPSRASIGRPESRASHKRPQSAAEVTVESSAHHSPTMQKYGKDQVPVADGTPPPKRKKKNKSQKKRKQMITAEAPTGSEGQAKTGGSQDQDQEQGRAVSGQESPKKKFKTVHLTSDPADESSAPEVINKATADGLQEKIVEEQVVSKENDYRAHAGGSLRMKKNRSPIKPQQKTDQENNNKTPTKHESKPLQTVFEPPNEEVRNDISPDANLFPQQKFAIDQARASAAPRMSLGNQEHAIKIATANTRIGSLPPGFNPYPQLPPNTKPSAWSTVAKRHVKEDPFSSGRAGYDQSKDWMNDKTVKPPQKPRCDDGRPEDTSPTPSPEKKASHGSGKSKTQLNAAAKVFTPLSSPARSVASLMLPAAGHTSAAPAAPTGGAGAGIGQQSRRASTTGAATLATKQPIVARGSAASGPGGSKPIPRHAKKPSLPGQAGSTDARFITPAEQILDPTRAEQPGAPTKEGGKRKKERADGPAPDRGSTAQQRKPTAAQVAAAADGAPALGNESEFPTLAAAAAIPKRHAASFAQAVATTSAVTTNTAAAAPALQKENVKPASPAAAPATSPNNVSLGRRGAVSGPAPGHVLAPVSAKGAEAQEKPRAHDWQTVGPSKKLASRNPTPYHTTRGGAAGGNRGGKVTQQGNRGGGDGGRAPVGEERKGG